jgi:hypothetical protein
MTAQPMPAQPIIEAQPAPQTAPPATHHIPPGHYQPRPPLLESIFGPKFVIAMVLIGTILFLIGGALATTAAVTEAVDMMEPDDIRDATEKAYTNYKMGVTLVVVGNSIMVMFLVGGSLMAKDASPYVRLGFLIFAAVLVIVSTNLILGYPNSMLHTGPTIWK